LRSEYTALPICQARPEEETGVKEEQEKPDWGINVSEVRRASSISRCHTFPHTHKKLESNHAVHHFPARESKGLV